MLVVLSWLPRMHGPLDLRWDGGVYYVLGTALAEGKGYRLLNEPGEIEAVQYPPLFAAIIAAHQIMLGTSDPFIVGPWLRLTFFLISLAYGVCSYLLLRIFLSPGYACGAVLMVLLNLFTNFLSDLCFAEMPFALVSIVFVLCNRKGGRFYPVITAILATATYLLRTIGIAVLIAWICEALLPAPVSNGRHQSGNCVASYSCLEWVHLFRRVEPFVQRVGVYCTSAQNICSITSVTPRTSRCASHLVRNLESCWSKISPAALFTIWH